MSSAALHGVVTTAHGAPISHAVVRLINTSNGHRWERFTSARGRYHFEDVAVGVQHRLEIRALGFRPRTSDALVLSLGSRTQADFSLVDVTTELPTVITIADSVQGLGASANGAASIIAPAMIAQLPNIGRDFLRLATWSPFAANSPSSGGAPTGGISIAGQNRALNNFLIDGGGHLDQYTGRLPGRETLPRPISIEALQEIQVLAAPFDVRHGGFAGGLVNAVTRSGTNELVGSTFAYYTGNALVGENARRERVQAFTTKQYGATLSGPVIRDRAHYFVALDVQDRVVPDPGPLIIDTAGGADTARIRISHASALRFQEILRDSYGLEPGTLGPAQGSVPAQELFAKIDLQPGVKHRLEISQRHARGERGGFIARGAPGQYLLSSAGRREPSATSATRLIWTALIGERWSNELIGGRLTLRDECRPNASYPLIRVSVSDVPGVTGELSAGTPNICPSYFGQTSVELTDNVTVGIASHVITAGARIGHVRFTDDLLQGSAGMWQFDNLDSLEAGVARRYDRSLAGPLRDRGVRFGVNQLAVYAQDRWAPASRLTITVGVRADAMSLTENVARNEALYASLNADTRSLPGGTFTWSPRASFTFSDIGDRHAVLRGGAGLFAGQPPYAWLASAYRDDGAQELFLTCSGSDVPEFDPLDQPASCESGATGRPRLTFFEPGLRMPQNLKMAIGMDRELVAGIAASADLLYTRSLNDLSVTDANLSAPVAFAAGEGGRAMYGTIAANGRATVSRRDGAFGQVAHFHNVSGDEAVTATLQLRRLFRRSEATVWYAHTRARDRTSLLNYPARANLENPPLDGTFERRRRGIAYFEIPHRLMVNVLTTLPRGTRIGMTWNAAAGAPFTYVVRGDANADEIGGGLITNDVIYVPRDSSDISLENPATWSAVNDFIASEPCLDRQRGRLLARNSCRNATSQIINGRVTHPIQLGAGHRFELTADVYNVLNLLNRRWGLAYVTTGNPVQPILQLRQWDAARERGVYSLLSDPRRVQDAASRWQVEISARYSFSRAPRPTASGDARQVVPAVRVPHSPG